MLNKLLKSSSVVFFLLTVLALSVYAKSGMRVSFSDCYIDIPDIYSLFVDSEYRKVYLNNVEGQSLEFSNYGVKATESFKLVSSEIVNGFFLEEYILLEEIRLLDGNLSKFYKINDGEYEMSFINMKKNDVLDFVNSCKSN